MTTLREVQAAYQDGRRQAQTTTAVRLRFAERRIGRREGQLTETEQAFLKAVRDERWFRGVEVAS
jgi:hypothetical protein